MSTPEISLYLNSGADYRITDDDGRAYTPAEARALWESGRVGPHNLGVYRLCRMGWDLDALKRFYAEADAARRPAPADVTAADEFPPPDDDRPEDEPR